MIQRYDTTYSQKGNKDCVIITLANHLRVSYENVILAAESIGVTPELIAKRGVLTSEIDKLLIRLCPFSIWQVRNPRRGQEKITGFARWHSVKGKPGHLNYIKAGMVYDTDGWQYSIDDYRRYFKINKLERIWVQVRRF